MTGRHLLAVATFALVAWVPPAFAVQPLEVFLAGAQKTNVDTLEAQATLAQQDAQHDFALGKVLPGIGLRGTYTRNQYEVVFPFAANTNITLVPPFQWDGFATLTVPLIDIAGFERVAAAKTAASSAGKQLANTRLQVEATVAQDYYQLVANLALVTSAQKALDVSRESLRLATARRDAGVGPELDVDRARAEVESQTQQVAAAQLQVALSARALETASGIAPDQTPVAGFTDQLQEAAPLASFESQVEKLPSVQAAIENTRANEQLSDAQKLTLIPTLAGTFTEHGTNVPGLTVNDLSWQAVITLSWTLDLTTRANIHLQEATADVARAREQRARLAAGDSIHRQWSTITAGIVRSKSARAGQEAATHAASQARDRYEAGTITQLDLLQAQRDAFVADVTRIQADADLVNARAQLRLAAGSSLLENTQPAQAR